MSKITTQERKNLPKKDFALPSTRSNSGGKGGYPIDTEDRARNALARVSQFGSESEKATVRAAVHSKFPDIGDEEKKTALMKKYRK